MLLERADLLVWLDLARATVMRQVSWRTLRRRTRREALWNGNIEPPLHTFFTNPEHIVRWAWSTRHAAASRVATAAREHPGLVIVRLDSRRSAYRWLAGPLSAAATHAQASR
ncbi:MAG: hypothetical protein ACRDL8_00690 [Solirubrobacteraceae bacterium]